MVYFYWPFKSVPDWLEHIEFSGKSNGVPIVRHNGFGIVLKRAGEYQVYPLCGGFAYINGAGMTVSITGGGKGVTFHTKKALKADA